MSSLIVNGLACEEGMDTFDPACFDRIEVRYSLAVQVIQEGNVLSHVVQAAPACAPSFGS